MPKKLTKLKHVSYGYHNRFIAQITYRFSKFYRAPNDLIGVNFSSKEKNIVEWKVEE